MKDELNEVYERQLRQITPDYQDKRHILGDLIIIIIAAIIIIAFYIASNYLYASSNQNTTQTTSDLIYYDNSDFNYDMVLQDIISESED